MKMLSIEDALCKLCYVSDGHGLILGGETREDCPACGGKGYVMEGCCQEGEECEHEEAATI